MDNSNKSVAPYQNKTSDNQNVFGNFPFPKRWSLSIGEVKQHRAMSELKWATDLEHRVNKFLKFEICFGFKWLKKGW